MNTKTLHNFTWIPLVIIGIMVIVLGLSFLFLREPWLLDKTANETLLHTRFYELFTSDVNSFLQDYLRSGYRFFGWWIFASGLILINFVQVTRMGTGVARNSILGLLGFILSGLYIIMFIFIPDSRYIWLTHIITLLYLISLIASQKLNKIT